ncbi:MAG: hypothetical protein ACPGVU_14100 [Limisphaerales bacterium]
MSLGYDHREVVAQHVYHMTKDPVSIERAKLAAEVVCKLELNRINEIVVIDEQNHAIGLVDVQNLSRARIC